MITISYIAIAVALGLAGIDQLIKWAVVANIPLFESIPVWPGVFSLTYVENTGAAFSSFLGQRWFLIIVTGIAIAVMLYLLIFKKIKNPVILWHVSVILAGGIGNIIDRIFHGGAVIDYIELKFIQFAIFNFADALVVCGVISLAVYILFFENRKPKEVKIEESNEAGDVDE